MAENPITLTKTKRGDSWRGIGTISVVLTGTTTPPPNPIARIDMHFKRSADDVEPTLALSTEDDTITIVDAEAWQFSVPVIKDFPLEAGTWHWDVQVIDSEGELHTPCWGTLAVTKDITIVRPTP